MVPKATDHGVVFTAGMGQNDATALTMLTTLKGPNRAHSISLPRTILGCLLVAVRRLLITYNGEAERSSFYRGPKGS